MDDGTSAYLHDVAGNSVSIDSSDVPTYTPSDALGSTRLTVDDTGTPIGTREWDAWGNQRSSTGTGYAFGRTGEQYDPSSNLVYLRARYYSSGTGSFLSRDTMQPNAGGPTGYNPYAYANGNPTTFTDPSGHFGIPGFPVVGVFLLLALLFECYISGLCRYAAQHADEWANSAAQGAMSSANFAAMAINRGLRYIIENWPSGILFGTSPGSGWDWQNRCLLCPIVDPILDTGRELLPRVFGTCVGGEAAYFVYDFFVTYCRVFDTSGEFAYSVTISTLPNYQIGIPLGISADASIILSNASSVWDLAGCADYAGLSTAPRFPFESMIMVEHGEDGYGYTFEVGVVGGLDSGVEIGNACTWVSSDWWFGSLDYVRGILDAAARHVEGCLFENYLQPWRRCV